MNLENWKKLLQKGFWRIGLTWHYLALFAVVLLVLLFRADLSFKLAALIFTGVTVCFALLNTPLEPLRELGTKQKNKPRKKLSGNNPSVMDQVLDALPDPLLILDERANLIHANERACALFSLTPQGQHISAILRDPDLLEAIALVEKSKSQTNLTYIERVPIEQRFAVNVAWLADEAGRPDGASLLVHFRDLTEQERLNQMRTDFIANASHELRTPLASLLGFIETLQGPARDDPAAQEKFLGIMAKQGERMGKLINDLLSLSRVEMNIHTSRTKRINLKNILNYVIDLLVPVAAEQNIKLELIVDDAGEYIVLGDHDELVQLFQNLMQNAIKYGRENGTVKVKMSNPQSNQGVSQRIAIAISDDGIGIAREHLPRLTERFYRVDNDLSREKGGTGLGLAIVKHVLNHHGGDLKINSVVGKGSTFTVFLPAADRPASDSLPPSQKS